MLKRKCILFFIYCEYFYATYFYTETYIEVIVVYKHTYLILNKEFLMNIR